MNVKEIDGKRITVENSFGDRMYVSRDILEQMESADHYEKEVQMTKTELAELLQGVQDHVFTVYFHKKPTVENTLETLQNASQADF